MLPGHSLLPKATSGFLIQLQLVSMLMSVACATSWSYGNRENGIRELY